MKDEILGVELVGGPKPFDGWKNAYPADPLGGWPPPEKLAAFLVAGTVAVALPEKVPPDWGPVILYRKIAQSELSSASKHLFRGATYEYMEDGMIAT